MREAYAGTVWCDDFENWAAMSRPEGSAVWFCEFCGDDHSPVACKFCGESVGVHVCDGSLIV